MAKRKLRVGVLFGGKSGEHEVSLLSAASILKAIDRKRFEVVPIGITKQGQWLGEGEAQRLLAGEGAQAAALEAAKTAPSGETRQEDKKRQRDEQRQGGKKRRGAAEQAAQEQVVRGQAIQLAASAELAQESGALAQGLDVVFPVLHGTFGEDGTIQGLFELADVAYVGSGVLGSAAGMDKDVMKRLFGAAGLPQTPYLALLRSEWKTEPKKCVKRIEAALQYPVFVKPANLGSSVGISKVHDRSELAAAMDLAAGFDRKLVVEQGVGGPGVKPRELEVAVLGNDRPEASVVGEIVPGAEFYDYEAKYQSDASVPIVPAELTQVEAKEIRAMAIAAFRACQCSGLARVDFLMEPKRRGAKSRIYLNEINTMPGFTSISMYPKLWGASGVGYTALITRLIELAVERQAEKAETRFTR
jgi:D-alanine-D-alanine ligase